VGTLAATATVLIGVAIALLATGVEGLLLAGVAALVAAVLGVTYSRWLGGATGDCLGAATELSETVVLVVAAGLA
jgi:cobalamin synthase